MMLQLPAMVRPWWLVRCCRLIFVTMVTLLAVLMWWLVRSPSLLFITMVTLLAVLVWWLIRQFLCDNWSGAAHCYLLPWWLCFQVFPGDWQRAGQCRVSPAGTWRLCHGSACSQVSYSPSQVECLLNCLPLNPCRTRLIFSFFIPSRICGHDCILAPDQVLHTKVVVVQIMCGVLEAFSSGYYNLKSENWLTSSPYLDLGDSKIYFFFKFKFHWSLIDHNNIARIFRLVLLVAESGWFLFLMTAMFPRRLYVLLY